jgi:tight adherence protein B
VSAVVVGVLAAVAAFGVALATSRAGAVLVDRRVRRRLRSSPPSPWATADLASIRAAVHDLRRRVGGRVGGDHGDRALPELLGGVARELRSGASLSAAIAVSADGIDPRVDPSCGDLARTLKRGGDLEAALGSWSLARPGPGRQLAATALTLGARTGGASALVVDGVADTLRDRLAIDREVAALSSQARASAALLVGAPVVVAAVAAAADPRIASFLVGSPIGWGCIAGGLVLDLVGAAWMRAIVAGAR